MTNSSMSNQNNPPSRNKDSSLGAGVAIGVAPGAGMGVAMDNLALGIAIGLAMGAGIGAAMDQQGQRDE